MEGNILISKQITKRATLSAGLGTGAFALLEQGVGPYALNSLPCDGCHCARPMPDRLTDIINVKDYGAVGDGTTDDTAALLAAIYVAAAKGTSRAGLAWKGASVFLPSGQYRITQQLTLPAGVSNCQVNLIGSGESMRPRWANR